MTLLTYTIPLSQMQNYASGAVELVGAVLKDTTTGQIVAHVQPTRVLDHLLNTAAQGVTGSVAQGFSPLGAISIAQNHLISQKLSEMSQALGLLQSMQIASLAVSGLGLGVSVAGFAMVHRQLKGINARLESLSGEIAQVTADRRQDELRSLLTDIATEIDVVETLEHRVEKSGPGDAASRRLNTLAGQVGLHFSRHIKSINKGTLNQTDLDFLWSLAAAVRLCHDMSGRALYTINELGTAASLGAKQSQKFLELTEQLPPPDALARIAAGKGADRDKVKMTRERILPIAKQLRTGLADSVLAVASQAELARDLLLQGVSGPEYLERVSSEQEEPLLFIAASNGEVSVG